MSPPHTGLAALRGFEAAARLGSFAAAAAVLNVTQSAVSHQVRTLESELGQPLFRRIGRSVRLTDAGRDLAQTVAKVLRTLDAGFERLAPYANPRSVILYCDAAFGRGMLLPRLGQLRERCPDIDLWIDTSGRAVNVAEDEVDLLVTTRPDQGTAASVTLLEDGLVALAAPALIARLGGPPLSAAALAGWPLLHDEEPVGWRAWLIAAGARISPGTAFAGATFSDTSLALAAAVDGNGAVLSSRVGADDLMASGRLVLLFVAELPSTRYRLEADSVRIRESTVAAVRDWLLEITAAHRG